MRRLSAWPRCGKAVGCLKSLTPKYDRPKESDMRADKQNDNVSRLSQVIPVCLRSECFAFCEIPSVSGHFPFDSALTDLLTDLSTDGLTDFGNPGGAQGCLLSRTPRSSVRFSDECAGWRGEPKLRVRIAYHVPCVGRITDRIPDHMHIVTYHYHIIIYHISMPAET